MSEEHSYDFSSAFEAMSYVAKEKQAMFDATGFEIKQDLYSIAFHLKGKEYKSLKGRLMFAFGYVLGTIIGPFLAAFFPGEWRFGSYVSNRGWRLLERVRKYGTD